MDARPIESDRAAMDPVARAIDPDLVAAPHLDGVVEQGGLPKVTNRHAIHPALPSSCVKRIPYMVSPAWQHYHIQRVGTQQTRRLVPHRQPR